MSHGASSNGDPNRPIGYSCPYCEGKNIETVATAPYVRGFLVAYQMGSKNFIGCVPCVRKLMFKEVGKSTAIGWFSITALFINPVLIAYNLCRAPFVRVNYKKARKTLEKASVPEDAGTIDLTEMGYVLAVAMIAADGQIEQSELETAIVQGA